MTDEDFQRARSPERKAERRAAILAAAADLLDDGGTEAATLSAIAAKAGVVKSGLYRYYESREDILIQLLIAGAEDLIAGFERVDPALGPRLGPAPGPPLGPADAAARTAGVIAQGFAARPRLCLLLSEMAPTLERNLSLPTLIALKTRMAGLMTRAGAATMRIHGDLSPEAAGLAIRTATGLVAGQWPMANPGPLVAEAIGRSGMHAFNEPFETGLARAMHAVLIGAEGAAHHAWAKDQ